MVLKSNREKKPSSYQLMTRRSVVNYSRFIGDVMVLMQKPSVIESLSGRMPKKVPRWDLMGTEGCGGVKVVSWLPWKFLGYLSIYIGERSRSGGHQGAHMVGECALPPWARPQPLWSPRGSSDLHSKSPGCLMIQEKSSRKFYSVWYSFSVKL